jgi:hypothetical protein
LKYKFDHPFLASLDLQNLSKLKLSAFLDLQSLYKMTASSSIVKTATNKVSSTSRTKDKSDYERVGEKSDCLTVTIENNQNTSNIQNDYSPIGLASPLNTQIKITTVDSSNRRWMVLASFSLLSFSNAVLWITFRTMSLYFHGLL